MKKLWDWAFIRAEFIRYALACVSGKRYFSLARLAVANQQLISELKRQSLADSFVNFVYGANRTRKAARILAYTLAGFVAIVSLLIILTIHGR